MYKRDVVMFDLVSLTVGISPFPFGNSLSDNRKFFSQILLTHLCIFPQTADIFFNHNMASSLFFAQTAHLHISECIYVP